MDDDDLAELLAAAIKRDRSEQLELVISFGCQPFIPARDHHRRKPDGPWFRTSDGTPAKGSCPICRRSVRATGPPVSSAEPDYLVCGGCDRGSARFERRVCEQAHRERQRQHLIQHNRELTAETPTPAILLDAEPEPAPVDHKIPRRRRSLAERYGLEVA